MKDANMKKNDQTTKDTIESQTPGGVRLGELPCSQYIPFVEIPEEIHAAAQTLNIYFEKQGMREWEFSYLADRRLVTKLERKRDELKAALLAMRDHYRQCSIPGALYKQVEAALDSPNVQGDGSSTLTLKQHDNATAANNR